MINIIKIKKILNFQKVNGGLKQSTFIIFQLFINFAIKGTINSLFLFGT